MINTLVVLHERIKDAGIPIVGLSRNKVDYSPNATPEQIAAGNAMFTAIDWTAEENTLKAEEDTAKSDKADFKTSYNNAMEKLDTIIAADGATLAEVRSGLKEIARIVKKQLKISRREV